jgi:hypothetical protein
MSTFDKALCIDALKTCIGEFCSKLQDDEDLKVAEHELISAFWHYDLLFVMLQLAMDDGDLIRRYLRIELDTNDFELLQWGDYQDVEGDDDYIDVTAELC